MVINLQQLLPAYFPGDRHASSHVWLKDIAINPGDLIELVAPSGSGKTSLVHFLYGMRRDYTGAILYNNKALRGVDHEQMAVFRASQVSIVFQDLRLFKNESVRNNLLLKRQLSPYHTDDPIDMMASRLGISDKLDSFCGNCSYGEQQRIAIIRSLMQPFEVLLLDEPFSHLDNKNAAAAMDLILEEAALRKATVILADLEQTPRFPHTRLLYL